MRRGVSNLINRVLEENTDDNALINELHPYIDIKLNSVNVIVGKQGSGKTVVAIEEIVKASLLGVHHRMHCRRLIPVAEVASVLRIHALKSYLSLHSCYDVPVNAI